MPYLRCPRCGATHYSVARYASRDSCPRCLEPIDRDELERPMSLSCKLSNREEAAASARQAFESFRGHLEEGTIASSALVATELVTNSVKHSGGNGRPIDLSVTAAPQHVRIEVTDGGAGFEPEIGEAHPERESGWGLFLVDQLADRWGVEGGHSFRVWAEIARDPAPALA